MADEVIKNLDYLTKSITNIESVIIKLIEKGIFSFDEQEAIMIENTSSNRNLKLLKTIIAKDWSRVRKLFLDILKETNNSHCFEKIESELANIDDNPCKKRKTSLLEKKWWPEKKSLLKSFYDRKESGKLLIEELERKLEDSESGMTVISQKVTVSGLGGVGKTTTAKWFANSFSEKYEHIIWIDCGEGSLLKSFTKLARDLKIKNRSELDLIELSRESFENLKEQKCLWIFDNAECYVGNQGIRQVLPKNEKFHCIITSRNREWGNENGDGKIFEFQIGVFQTAESVDFLKRNVVNLPDEHDIDQQLTHFCELLGNLPLALQIAVATLNSKNIDIAEYMKRMRKTDDILHTEFDDYEKTINKTMKISLDVIKNYEGDSGHLAYKILSIFGYITPDSVDTVFFAKVTGKIEVEIKAAGDLLEKYSLITKRNYPPWGKVLKQYLSIHRLFQQVIRHNEKSSEKETLRKILSCKGYLDYKLIPYTFADEEVKGEFGEIRAELIDQFKLDELTKERRFQEAVDLSLIIKNTVETPSALFNYATCLQNNGERDDALEIYEKMYRRPDEPKTKSKDILEDRWFIFPDRNMSQGFLDLYSEPGKDLIAGQLFINYWKKNQIEIAQDILNKQKKLQFKDSLHVLNDVIQSLSSIDTSNYLSNYFIEKISPSFGTQIKLQNCSLFSWIQFPRDLNQIHLSNIIVLNEKCDKLETFNTRNCQFPEKLKYLDLSFKYTTVTLYSDQLNHVEHIKLGEGIVLHITSGKICPTTLTLTKCTFNCGEKNLTKVNLNQFINFTQMRNLELLRSETELSILMNEPVKTDRIILHGKTTLLDWTTSQWTMESLILHNIAFVNANQLKVMELEVNGSDVDLGVLPVNLQSLCIINNTHYKSKNKVNCSGQMFLPNLIYLQLTNQDPTLVSYFDNCLNLRYLYLIFTNQSVQLDVRNISKGVKTIKLSKSHRVDIKIIGDGNIILDTLILLGFQFKQLESQLIDITKILQSSLVAINCRQLNGKNLDKLMPLIQNLFVANLSRTNGIKTIIIGDFNWKSSDFQFSSLSKIVDIEAKYYSFENQYKGKAFQDQKYWQIIDLYYSSIKWNFSSMEKRLATFQNWKNSYLSKEYFAKSGFFYLPYWDKVQCAFCEKMLYDPRHIFSLDHNIFCSLSNH